MIIYSIIPEEIIFPQASSAKDDLQDIVVEDGVILETRHSHGDMYEVVRVISTDPEHYLKTMYSPGIHFHIPQSKSIE